MKKATNATEPANHIAVFQETRVRHQTLQVIDLLEVATLNCHYSNVI